MKGSKPQLTLSGQIKERLIKEIMEGEFKNAQQLPSEGFLAQKYGVSRSTLRAALASLEKEGIIFRRQGAGTRINRRAFSFGLNLNYIEDLHQVIKGCGYLPSIHLISYKEILALSVPEAQERLKVPSSEKLLKVEKLWKANDTPVFYFVDYLPVSLIKRPFTEEDLVGSVFDFIYEFCDECVDHSLDEIEAVLPPDEVVHILNIEKGRPLLFLTESFFNESGKPLLQGFGYLVQGFLRVSIKRQKI
jgi:GntR family transcriptional regulator